MGNLSFSDKKKIQFTNQGRLFALSQHRRDQVQFSGVAHESELLRNVTRGVVESSRVLALSVGVTGCCP